MKTSIILTTQNSLDHLQTTLTSILEHTDENSYELIIVDDGSLDGTRPWLGNLKLPQVKAILNNRSLGLLGSLNAGIRNAEPGHDLLFLRDDVVVAPNWLPNLKTALHSSPAIGGVSAVDPKTICLLEGTPVDFSAGPQALNDFAAANNQSDKKRWRHENALPGFCLLVKREAADRAGFWDEDLGSDPFAAADYSFRLLQAGFGLLACDDSFVQRTLVEDSPFENGSLCPEAKNRRFEDKWGFGILEGINAYGRQHLELLRLMEAAPDEAIHVLNLGCRLGSTLLAVKNKYPNARLYGTETFGPYGAVAGSLCHFSGEETQAALASFGDQCFDYILAGAGFDPALPPQEFLTLMKQHLKPGGYVVMNIKNAMQHSYLRSLVTGSREPDLAQGRFTPSQVLELFSAAGLENPLTYHWFDYLGSEDQSFIQSLCSLAGTESDFNFKTASMTVRAQRGEAVQYSGYPAPKTDPVPKVTSIAKPPRKRGGADQPDIHVFYHTALMERGFKILKEQLSVLETSGLAAACAKIHVTLAGPDIERAMTLFKAHPFFDKMVFTCHLDPRVFEFPTLEKIIAFAAANPQAKICYFHTKGASHTLEADEVTERAYTEELITNLEQLRYVMEYTVLERWQDCLVGLEEADICGMDWVWDDCEPGLRCHFGAHFPGNFWWANASYIQRCRLSRDDRYKCETFIGTGKPVVKNLFSSFGHLKNIPNLDYENMGIRHTWSDPPCYVFNFREYFYHPSYYR